MSKTKKKYKPVDMEEQINKLANIKTERTATDDITERMVRSFYTAMSVDRNLKSAVQFAARIKTSGTLVSRWIKGTGNCTLENVYHACKEMGWSPDYIILGRGKLYGDAEVSKRLESLEKRMDVAEMTLNITSNNTKKRH